MLGIISPRATQIRTTVRHHLSLVRMAIINFKKEQVLARVWTNWSPRALLEGV